MLADTAAANDHESGALHIDQATAALPGAEACIVLIQEQARAGSPLAQVRPTSAPHRLNCWCRPPSDHPRSADMLCRSPETGYAAGAIMSLTRPAAVAIAALAICAATAPGDRQPRPDASVITCTNPASGATWQISIDYEQARVDSNLARVSAAKVSWRDAKDGRNYRLDRRSGELTVIVASSTGGYFLHDHCRLPP